jgi:2-dehydro-3-deoxyphosphogluconate aldolase/(4S)-4-hydroxy-2-oxoglutarate aldolase
MVHIGINAENEEAALNAANRFSVLFGFKNKIGNSSIFSGDGIEIMKTPYLGKNGHIAIGTNSVFRAKAFFERQGVEFNLESARTDAKGNFIAIYFKEEIGNFAVHLVQKK